MENGSLLLCRTFLIIKHGLTKCVYRVVRVVIQGFVYIKVGSSDCQLDCRADRVRGGTYKETLNKILSDHTSHPVER